MGVLLFIYLLAPGIKPMTSDCQAGPVLWCILMEDSVEGKAHEL